MRTEFTVPTDSIVEFSDILAENELTNEILGTTEDNEIIVQVEFNKSDFDAVEQLEELVGESQENEE